MTTPAPAPRIPLEVLLEPHHRNVNGGPLRAAVFGISDGLVSNVSLVLGVAGAHPTQGFVRLAGFAGLLAGAFSMAAGEWVSMRAQTDLLQFELKRERVELARRPEFETLELAARYEQRGVEPELAREVASQMMKDPENALETHVREELGVDPHQLGSPMGAALSSFATFVVGAFVPLCPWLFASGTAAIWASIISAAVVAAIVGFAVGAMSGRHRLQAALRQLLISTSAATITFLIGRAVGTGVG